MMGRDDGQMKIVTVDIGEFVPESHILKKIDKIISFSFIYDKVKHLYSEVGRKSVDPVLLIKMLLIGYLFGIKSERRLEQEINLNLAYRCASGARGHLQF